MKVSVVLPARNEEKLIKATVLDMVQYLKKKKYSFEIIVVVNGSFDKTEEIVNNLSKKYRQIKKLKSKPGYGFALRKGLREARGEYIVVFNVDFYDLKLIDLVDIDMYGKDLIIGSKRARWSEDNRAFKRKLVSMLFNWYLKIIYGFKGSDTHGIKILKRKVLKKVLPKCKTVGGIFDTEFVIRTQRNGFEIADFPVKVREKRSPRFSNRLLETPKDIYNLFRALQKQTTKTTKKELFYNRISESWEDVINQEETKKRLKIVFDGLLSEVDLKERRFLEAGCGLGYFSAKAVELGANVTGIDVGERLVKKCKSRVSKARFLVASASSLPFKDGQFDIVLCTEVIEHVENQRKTISELFRVLKPGGFLVITTPNRLFKPFFDFLSLIKVRPYHGNEKWFYISEMRQMLTRNGGKIKRERYFNFICPNRFLDRFENFASLRYLMINQGYLVIKS